MTRQIFGYVMDGTMHITNKEWKKMKDESQGDEEFRLPLSVSPFVVNILHFVKDIRRL